MSHAPKRPRSGVVIPHRPRWHQRMAAFLIYALVRAVSATIRYEWRDESGLFDQPRTHPVIFCIWHNRLALCLEIYRLYLQKRGEPRPLAAMVSASKDGGILAQVLAHYGVQHARGSSSRRGRQALLELTTWAERGHDLAITPDGPRGPRYQVQDGVTALSQLTGLQIIPVSYHVGWKLQVRRSWDQFQIPLPFTRCVVHLSRPVVVPRKATDEERETLRQEVEQRMNQTTMDWRCDA